MPVLTSIAPSGITTRGPQRSINMPTMGAYTVAARKPHEKAAAVLPRSQPNSARMGGNNKEKVVRVFTPIASVTKATATTAQP